MQHNLALWTNFSWAENTWSHTSESMCNRWMYSATTILAASNQRKLIFFGFIVHLASSFSPVVFLLARVFHQLSPHFLSVWSDVEPPVSCQPSQPLLCVRAKVGFERMCVPHGARLRNSSRLPNTIPFWVHAAFNKYLVVLFKILFWWMCFILEHCWNDICPKTYFNLNRGIFAHKHLNKGVIYCTVVFSFNFTRGRLCFLSNFVTICNFWQAYSSMCRWKKSFFFFCFPLILGLPCNQMSLSLGLLPGFVLQQSYDRWRM